LDQVERTGYSGVTKVVTPFMTDMHMYGATDKPKAVPQTSIDN
jgi:hypothetical protein